MLKTLSRTDRVAFALFLVLWLGFMGMKLASVGHPTVRHVYVGGIWGDSGYPTVRGYMRAGAASETQLRPGDLVMNVGGHDLHGKGQLAFVVAYGDAVWHTPGSATITIRRDGREMTVREAQPAHQPASYPGDFVTSLAWGIAAVLIITRARQTATTRAIHRAMAASAILYTVQGVGPPSLMYAQLAVAFVMVVVTWPLLTLAFIAFPDEAGTLKGVHHWWPWLFLPLGIPAYTITYAIPWPPAERPSGISTAFSLVYLLTLVAALTVNYRRSGPLGRRQLRWTIASVYLGALATAGTYLAIGSSSAFAPDAPVWARIVVLAASASFPLSVMTAVLRYDLFDIDRVLGATVGYNLLGVGVVGGGLYVAPILTETMTHRLGVDPTTGRTGFIVVLAIIVIQAERRLRPLVERRFFKERFALEQAMRVLPETFASVRRADDLFSLTGRELAIHLRPASCVIYETTGDAFIPVVVEGESLPPAMPVGTPLLSWIGSLEGAALVGKREAASAGEETMAVLRSMGTRVVIPVHRAGRLAAFICLGEKRSGDIYTPTDLSLLTTLSKTISSHMLRFDADELLQQARTMQDKMRRYVPGAIADAIASGTELETGEREVSVLFVDMRGYTSFADSREAVTIFSTVNKYTDAVSSIVNECGGVVVEFNGDGMMAVFGAPRPLPNKERAAVQAAKRLVDAVPALRYDDPNAPPMRVGVGIATGTAFVGNIEAVDRTIWSAIGSTTNLAARLQSLTRELNAAVLIDERTYERSQDQSGEFSRHPDVSIRGRKRPETIYGFGSGAPIMRPSTET